MKTHPHDWQWLDATETIDVIELTRTCGVSVTELDELIDYGAVTPLQETERTRIFSAASVPPLRAACKLRRDYDLDLFTVALLTSYLKRIDALERELRSLHARTPSHAAEPPRDGPQPWREPHGRFKGGL